MTLFLFLSIFTRTNIFKYSVKLRGRVAKKFFLALAVVVVVSITAFAQAPDTLWTKTFGGSSNDYGYSVQQTWDGAYINAGETSSFGAGSADVYLIKTDSSGDTLWTNTLGGSSYDTGYSVQQTSDGGYIIAGTTHSYGAGQYDVYLIKTDAFGDSLWTNTFGGSDDDYGYSVQQTADGGYIIAGWTVPYGASSLDVYLIKTDNEGNQQWQRTFGGGSSGEEGYCVQQTDDGGYIIVGDIEYSGGSSRDIYLIKTDSQGNQQWSQTYGGSDDDHGRSVQQTLDGGYIIAGWTQSYGAGGRDVYLIRLESYLFHITPPSLAFPDLEIGYQDSASVYIINPTIYEVTLDTASNSLAVFSFGANVIGSVVPADDSLQVWVYFTPDSSALYSDTLLIYMIGSTLTLPLSGTGTGAYISLSDDTLDFGLWEPNIPYPVRSFTFTNLGNDELLVQQITGTEPAFSISANPFYILNPGEVSTPVAITFIPPTEGYFDGLINMPTNAYNAENDTAHLYVTGGWAYTPAPVYDLTITIEGADAILNWSLVDTSIYGNPVFVDAYLVYYSELPYNPDSLFFFHGLTIDTTYTHEYVVQFSENMFYFVEAYIGEIGFLEEIIAQSSPLNKDELDSMLEAKR